MVLDKGKVHWGFNWVKTLKTAQDLPRNWWAAECVTTKSRIVLVFAYAFHSQRPFSFFKNTFQKHKVQGRIQGGAPGARAPP